MRKASQNWLLALARKESNVYVQAELIYQALGE